MRLFAPVLLPRFCLLFLLLPFPATAAQPFLPGLDPDLDASARYEAFLSDGKLDGPRIEAAFEKVRPRLEGLHLLFVPSWLSSPARAASGLGLVALLDGQAAALRREGFQASVARVNSEASVPANALALQAEIEALERPVCLVSHSKGGLDALEFLLRAEPTLRARIRCWVALQTPFGGSLLADLASDQPALRWMARQTLTALGGSERSLLDLREDVRRPYLETFDPDIRALARELPILSFASWMDQRSLSALPTYASGLFLDWLSRDSLPNDGLVTVPSAVLPHAPYVVAGGIDHNMAIAGTPVLGSDGDRLLLMKLLLTLVITLDRV